MHTAQHVLASGHCALQVGVLPAQSPQATETPLQSPKGSLFTPFPQDPCP